MERRPFTIPELPPLKRFVRALPFVAAWVVIAPLIAIATIPHLGAWTVVVELGFLFVLIALHIRTDPRIKIQAAVLMSPCLQCGKTPMRFDRGSEGDYVFICDQ